jgi:RNA polymerase sigma-70 factor (ECF subfamily)
MSPVDPDLLRRAQRGDHAAFAELVRAERGPVFNLALRLLGDRAEAEDVLQEALTRGWSHLPRLKAGAAFRTWLFRITVNLCRDRGRARSRHPVDPLPDNIVRLSARDPGPEDVALARERIGDIAAALAAIPEEFRAAVVLRDVQQLSYEEIAEVLRIPPGTVRSRISRGRGELRILLAGNREDAGEVS